MSEIPIKSFISAYDAALKTLQKKSESSRKLIKKYSAEYSKWMIYSNAASAHGLSPEGKLINKLRYETGNYRNLYADGVELGGAAFIIACKKFGLKVSDAISKTVPEKIPEKYLKLRTDVKEALKAGKAAEKKVPRDGGPSNLDGTMIFLPRWNKKLVVNMTYPHSMEWGVYLGKSGAFLIYPDTRYQGDKRSINAETVTKYLRKKGYDAFDYQQMD